MAWFYNLKIATKLTVSFVLVLFLTVSLGGFSMFQLAKVNQTSVELGNIWLPSMREILEIKVNLASLESIEQQYATVGANPDMAHYTKTIEALRNKLKAGQDKYRKVVQPAEKDVFERVQKQYAEHMSQIELTLAAVKGEKDWEVPEILKREAVTGSRKKLDDSVAELIKINERNSAEAATRGNSVYSASRIWIVGFLAASVALGLGLAFWIARIVSRPLKLAVGVAEKVASGDLTANFEVTYADETGDLMQALKGMNASLIRIVAGVRSGTETIATASSEIASGNMDLSQRTEDQASTLEKTAASMSELTSTVRQNADNAQRASTFADSASTVAQKGSAVVSQVVETMGSINKSAVKIVDIISVIDGIAFQTNILALNAAVEAARAGEEGRGFAVVASEVRVLAQRSASAAKEIKILIGNSVEQIDQGAALVSQAGTTMDEIVVNAKKVADIIGDITMSTQFQAGRIETISHAIEQLERGTQQNAALVEQATAASGSLRDQAATLVNSVSVFKVNEHNAKARRPSAAAAERLLIA
ncbi:MAG: methyl-accepting chemotaxis protein [Telluria sp.]|nr:methyl-accepting chemotaxis protein [Telluria sp.]